MFSRRPSLSAFIATNARMGFRRLSAGCDSRIQCIHLQIHLTRVLHAVQAAAAAAASEDAEDAQHRQYGQKGITACRSE